MRTILFLLLSTTFAFGQFQPTKWSFGLGVNFVDYTATLLKDDFGIYQDQQDINLNRYLEDTNNWNFGMPRISATYYWKKNLSIEGSFSLNKITKIGTNSYVSNRDEFISLDFNAEYRFLNPSFFIQPYVLAGFGGTKAPVTSGMHLTINSGLGIDLWSKGSFGLYAKTMLRYGGNGVALLPHTYHSIGLIYRKSYKGRWKRGCLVN